METVFFLIRLIIFPFFFVIVLDFRFLAAVLYVMLGFPCVFILAALTNDKDLLNSYVSRMLASIRYLWTDYDFLFRWLKEGNM
jgi:hypothetical protein